MNRPQAVINQRRDQVVALTQAGLTAHRIAVRLGVCQRTVERDRAVCGVTPPPMECRGGRYGLGCRCDLCRARNTEQMRRWKARAKRRGVAPSSHGASIYKNWGCRCEVCSAAHSAACRAYNESRRGVLV